MSFVEVLNNRGNFNRTIPKFKQFY